IFFFFQAEDGIRDKLVTGVQTCALPIFPLGRTTMDILRDTGNYAFALKAGLQFAAAQGEPGAKESLAKIEAAQARGVYFGSKDRSEERRVGKECRCRWTAGKERREGRNR